MFHFLNYSLNLFFKFFNRTIIFYYKIIIIKIIQSSLRRMLLFFISQISLKIISNYLRVSLWLSCSVTAAMAALSRIVIRLRLSTYSI